MFMLVHVRVIIPGLSLYSMSLKWGRRTIAVTGITLSRESGKARNTGTLYCLLETSNNNSKMARTYGPYRVDVYILRAI